MKKISITLSFVFALVAFATWAPNASAYSNFSGGCDGCHGGFRDGGYVSNQDGVAWNDSLHGGHQGFADCTACHQQIGDNPLIAGPSGDGFDSCMGCHGRDEDANNMGTGPGRGAGLRQHHWVNGIQGTCSGCHPDSNPANFTPVGEDVPGARNADLGIDPCNDAVFGAFGSDNDGDNLYDGDDPDCQAAAVCGDGVLDPATEECDDGNNFDGDGCQADCLLPICGDGIIDSGEQCDDGNNTNGDGCQADCQLPYCGDGIQDDSEACDDGN
jgi:cysteine-rich repeat protein